MDVSNNEIKILCGEFTNNDKELQTSVDESGNREDGIEYPERAGNFTGGKENSQTLDSVREGSGELHGISEKESAIKRRNVDKNGISDSVELREIDRNVSVAQRELERRHVTNIDGDREVHVPKKISENRYVSRFARTQMEEKISKEVF